MPSVAAVRLLSDGSLNVFSQNLTGLTCEWSTFER